MSARRTAAINAKSLFVHVATCQTCGWSTDARNAQALGKQHAQRTQHTVVVEVGWRYTYNVPRASVRG